MNPFKQESKNYSRNTKPYIYKFKSTESKTEIKPVVEFKNNIENFPTILTDNNDNNNTIKEEKNIKQIEDNIYIKILQKEKKEKIKEKDNKLSEWDIEELLQNNPNYIMSRAVRVIDYNNDLYKRFYDHMHGEGAFDEYYRTDLYGGDTYPSDEDSDYYSNDEEDEDI